MRVIREGFHEIKLDLGCSIEDAVVELHRHRDNGESVYAEFNDYILYSDTVTVDNAYKALSGMTKAEYDVFVKEEEKRMAARLKERHVGE